MADSATAKKLAQSGASFARRYGLAFASVAGALLLDLLFRRFNLPHPFAAFALSAIAITFWYGGAGPGIVAVLLSSLIRGFMFEGETSTLSRVLYELVFVTFAILMVWVRRRKEALEVSIVDRTARLTAANEDLLRRKEELDGLFELSPDAVILTDENFNVLRVNKEFTRIFGYAAEEVAGQWLPDLIVPEELRAQSLTYRALLSSGKRVELEVTRLRKGGVRFDVSVVAKNISLGVDQVAFYLIYRDITERKNAERQLRQSESYLAEAQRLSHTGSFGWSIPSGELFWSEETFQIFQYDQTTKPTVELFLQRVYPEDAALVKQTIELASRDGKNFEHEYRLLMPDGSVKYVHAVAHASWDKSGGIEFVGAVSDVTPRKRAEEAVRRSEAYLTEGQRLAKTGSWAVDPKTERCIYWSEEMRQIFGLDPQSNLPNREEFLRLVHPEDRDGFNERVDKAIRAKADLTQDYRIVLPDGTVKHILGIGHLVLDETGNIIECVGTDMDVTERKRAEEKLRRSEADLLEAQRISQTGSWKHDVLAGTVTVSPEVFRIFGVKPDEDTSITEFWLSRNHPEDQKRIRELFERSEIEKTNYEADYRIVLPDGAIKHLHALGHPVLNESGELVEFIGTVMDITERKKAESELRRSEGYLAEAQKLTHTGSWSLQVPPMKNVYWSKEMYRIFDLDPDSKPPSYLEVGRFLHPEDAPHRTRVFEQAIRDRTDFETDFRIRLPNGVAKYIHVVGHPVVNASGDVIELLGTVMDVTERKQAEDKIREHEVELRRILDAAPQHLSVLRGDGSHLYINQSSLDFLGLTLEEWQKRDMRELAHPDDADRVARERQQALSNGSPLEIESRLRRYDGEYHWFFLHYKPLKDQLGRITRWVVPAIDIEDRKRAEERMRNENLALREQIDQAFMFEEIVGSSPALQAVLSSIVKVAPTDSTVLITGETGTGKELIARAIHKHSQRSGHAFISVNCASIPSSLIASELFGHEKGAFTGAVQRRQGRFELAHSGTIFLDEVGELPAEAQIALLRVLQERQFERVGGNRILTTDVRVIAATNRDLTAAIAAGTFRSDLFYRLNVFPIEVPPLRKRKEDIPMLVEYFVKRYAEKAGKQIRKIEVNTLELCHSYPWPGNIRELQNIIERSVILGSGDTFWIEKAWLASPEPARQEMPSALPDALQNQEREIIETALAECNGRVAGPDGAAVKLGIPRSTLDSKIKQLKIKKHKFISENQ